MQPLQDDFRDPAAKDNNMTNAATVRRNLDAAITMRFAETELQNTIELRATASEIVAPKPDLDARAKKRALFKRIFRRKITSAKMEKICWQITVAAFMQPLQYDLRSPAAKDNSITHAATAWSNLHAAITMRSAETELQNTIELRATASEIVAPKPDRRQSEKKNDFEALFKRIFRRKITSAKMEKKTHFVRDFLQNSIGNSSTSTTCNPIYIAGTILQLQITMELCRPHMHEKHLKPHLQCGTDPRMIRPHTRPSRTRRTAEVDHRRSGTDFVWKNTGFRASAISQKRISWRDFLQNSIGNSSTSTTCNPIYIAGTILQLQITMEFCRPHMHEKHLKTPFTMRNRSENDPTMIRPHTRPSRTRRTAEVDHRRSGTDFVWKNTGFRASAISQKRISCETSFKTPSATHPPAPLAIPFTLRERSYSCKSQWNSVGRACTKNTWNPIYNAEPIREWSDHDPTTHETVSHPSHRRGRSSAFGDGLCMEKHRVSCICYLSKTHFVRDFLQNSIGNSSTSTTCNPIYIAGTISLTNSFPNELFLCSFFD